MSLEKNLPLLIFLSAIHLLGCTQTGAPQAPLAQIPIEGNPGISPAIPELSPDVELPIVIPPVVAPTNSEPPITQQAVVEKMEEVKQLVAADPVYSVSAEEIQLLVSEGVLDSDSELDGWVK